MFISFFYGILLNRGLDDASVKICNTKTTSFFLFNFSFFFLSSLSVNFNVLPTAIKIVIYKNWHDLYMYSGSAQINVEIVVCTKNHVTVKTEVMAM